MADRCIRSIPYASGYCCQFGNREVAVLVDPMKLIKFSLFGVYSHLFEDTDDGAAAAIDGVLGAI